MEDQIQLNDSFMDFAYKSHKVMRSQNLSLVYEGEINQNIVKTFTALAEKNLSKSDESTKTKKTVYHVMVECLQNIVKHGDEEEDDDESQEEDSTEEKAPSGIIIVGDNEEAYSITTGNIIPKDKTQGLADSLKHVNNLSREELRELYKDKMRNNEISDKGGAGLGFIDIAKKTGNKLEYNFVDVDNDTSFFLLKITVDKRKNS